MLPTNKIDFPSRYRKDKETRTIKQLKNIVKTAVLTVVIITIGLVIYYPIVKGLIALAAVEPEPDIPTLVVVEEPKPVVRIKIKWTQERIIEEINKTFPDAPIMVSVAKCEGVVKGKLEPDAFNPTNGSNDRGIFQISDKYHKKTYQTLGFDDMTEVSQNLAYARVLYDKNGLRDWRHSRSCWGKHL